MDMGNVRNGIDEVQFVEAGEFLFFCELVEVDFEGLFMAKERIDVGAVAAIAGGDVGELLAAEFELCLGPIEIVTEHAGEATALGVGIAEDNPSILEEPLTLDTVGLDIFP